MNTELEKYLAKEFVPNFPEEKLVNNEDSISENEDKDLFKKSLQFNINPKSYASLSQYNNKDIRDYIEGDINPDRDINYQIASGQSGWEQAGRAVGGGLYKGVLTAAEDVGYLFDIENNAKRLIGLEDVNSNWLSDLAKQAKESFDENHPIYRYNPTKTIDLNDSGFWWSALQGMIDSAVGFGLVGAGAGATVGRGIKYLGALGKFGVPVQNLMATAGTALTTNYAEGKMMALELFTNSVNERMKQFDDSQYKKAVEQAKSINPLANNETLYNTVEQLLNSEEYINERGLFEKQVRSIAGKEADIFQARNMVFMLSDAIAINGMFKGKGYTRNLLKEKSIKNAALEIAKQAPTEYIEEVGQGMFQKEGEYQAMKESGADVSKISSDPIDRAWEFFTDPQTQLEGFMGLFGGPVQHVLVQAPSNMLSGSDKEYRDRQTQQVKENEQLLNSLVSKQIMFAKAKEQAIKTGNIEAFNAITNDEFSQVAYKNFTAGTTENLENHLKEITELTPEQAAEKGYDENYKEAASKRLEELSQMESTYLKILRKHGGEKDHLIHGRLFNIENKRNFITNTLADLKQEKNTLLGNIKREVETLEDITLSNDQMKLKNIELNIKSLAQAKAKLTSAKNEALTRPNKKLQSVQNEYYTKLDQLNNLKRNKAPQEEIISLNNEVVALRDEFNRLSQFADEKTSNKKIVNRVNKLYNGRLAGIESQIEQLQKNKEAVKNTLKNNNEKINAFNEKDYSKWEDLTEIQNKIDNFTNAKKLYDDEYSNIISNKSEYIKEVEDYVKENNIEGKQRDIDSKVTPDEKQQVIDQETDAMIKEELERKNSKNIKDEQRAQREEDTRQNANKQFSVQTDLFDDTIKDVEEVNTTDEINSRTNETIIDDDSIEDVQKEVDNVQDEISKRNQDITEVTEEGPVFSGRKVEKGFNLLAYLSRLYKRIIDGNKISKQDIDNELNEKGFNKLLNPNKYGIGTKVRLEVTPDPTLVINNETGETFGEYLANNGLLDKEGNADVTSELYIKSVPISVYDIDGNIIGYIHQDSWINDENIYGDITKAKENLLKIRKEVVSKGKYETTITNKSIGYLFRNINGVEKVSKAIEDPNLIIAVGGRDELFGTQDINRENISNKNIISGYTYMIVQTGTNSNGKVYTAIPLINTKVSKSDKSKEIISTITNVIRIFYKLNSNISLSPEEQYAYETLGKQGFAIDKLPLLTQYVNQFIQVYYSGGKDLDKELKKFKNPNEKILLSIDNSQIQFVYVGRKYFIKIGTTTPEQLEASLKTLSEKVLPNMYTNINKNSLKSNIPVKSITVDNSGKLVIEDMYESYLDYAKDNTNTDILGKKVDTDEKGNDVYTYTVQPKITLDFNKILNESTDPITDEVYNNFIDNNIVPVNILNNIADKVINHNQLSQRETAIFTGKTSEINDIIRNKQNNESSNIIVKKADIERRRKEELNEYKNKDVSKVEEFTFIDEDGGITYIQIRTYPDGKRVAYQGIEKNKYGNVNDNSPFIISKEQSTEDYLKVAYPKDIFGKYSKTDERTGEESSLNMYSKKINAKYDAELAELEKQISSNESYESLEEDEFGNPEFYTDEAPFLPALEESDIKEFSKLSPTLIVEGLDVTKQNAIVDILFSEALDYAIKNVGQPINPNTIYNPVFDDINKSLETQNKNLETVKRNLEKATSNNDEVAIDRFNKELRNVEYRIRLYSTYINNKELLTNIANNRLKADSIISQVDNDKDEWISEDPENENEKIYDKSSYESDPSDKLSKKIKRFLSGIRVYNKDGSVQKNILKRDKLMNYEEVYRQLQVLTSGFQPDYNEIMTVLKSNVSTFPFLKDVIAKLEDTNTPNIESIQNDLTTLLTNHYANSVLVMYRMQDGKVKLVTESSNSNSIEEAIREGWNDALQQSELVEVNDDGTIIISEDKANSMIEQYNEWSKNPPKNATPEVKQWMEDLGITLADKTWELLEKGQFKYGKEKAKTWEQLFKSGLFNILATQYLRKQKGNSIYEDKGVPTTQGVVKDLAKFDGKNTYNFHSNSHREGLKTVYSYGTNKYLTDLTRDYRRLNESKDNEGNTVWTSTIITDKMDVVFNSSSQWLNSMLKMGPDGKPMRAINGEYIIDTESPLLNNLAFFTVSLEALKKIGDQSRDNRELNKLSNAEIELTKIGLLQSAIQDVTGNNNRIIKLLYPTTSDKSTVMGINTVAANIEYEFATGNITQETINMLYNSLVLPEIQRIRQNNQLLESKKNINLEENYIIGAGKFLLLPELNDPKYGLFLADGNLNPDIHTNPQLQSNITEVIERYINQLTEDKIQSWIDNGIIKNRTTNIYLDENFYGKFNVSKDNTIKAIATDMVIQYLVGNANIFQTYIGDPALFTKLNKDKSVNIKETFINIGKRLASDIAPGMQGEGTTYNNYKVGFIADRKIDSKVYDALEKLLGKEKASKYKKINSTDAQEYTTLLEKLYVMNMHGKIERQGFYAKVANIINEELSKDNFNYINNLQKELSKEEFEYLKNLTLQPEKPVYVQNIVDKELGIERRLYIKSSAFALSPFLTTGTELDSLRIAMEKNGVSRVAYSSAVKLGNVNKPLEIWDAEGNILSNIDFNENNTLVIPRSGYRIQQEVPYNPLKEAINKVSQASKNLLINMLEVDGFQVDWFNNGNPVKGKVLQQEYMKLYKQMFELQQKELFKELEYNPITDTLNIENLKNILKEEAIKRNYPLSDLESFDLDEELEFLAYSPSAQKFEALLNSIITNRVIKMKFPGKSYVLGSEAGFKALSQDQVDFKNYDIAWTENFNGKELLAADGSGRPDQIILPWDFKDNIDMYIGEDGIIDMTKIPTKLLSRFAMRIPNQGPNSQAKVQVVGFFRGNVGDLIIAPKEFVTRMGSDFDVDKLYLYKYNYYVDSKAGKIKFSDITKEKAEELYNKRADKAVDNLLKALFGEEEFEKAINEDKEIFIDKLLKTAIWNKILDIHLAIHSNPDQRVQRQIHQPLDYWKLDTIAKELDEINNKKVSDKLFTGLSDEYQKQKFINAAAGKTLVGVFSNDSMFNAIAQGHNLIMMDGEEPLMVRFGSKISNGNISNPYTLSTQMKLAKVLKEKNSRKNINEVNPYDYLKADEIVYKSEVISGFQSGAVDNEKEQILDKINANVNTASVIKIMTMLGFEEEIPYFLTQDIIKDYVEELRKLRGLGEFVANVEQIAYKNIINKDKYKVVFDFDKHYDYIGKELSVTKMKDMLQGNPIDNYKLRQRGALEKFLELVPKGKSIGKLQSILNVDSQGLGKTLFDTLIRESEIEKIGRTIINSSKLLGDNTIPGLALQYGLKLNNKLWSRLLPYNRQALVKTFEELERIYNKEELSRDGRVTFRTKMWNEIKKYRFSDPNLFTNKETITDPTYLDTERKRLFINTKDNKSLAKILQDAKKTFSDNAFLSALNVNVRKGGLPSIIKFRASNKEFSNEIRLYEGITDLILNAQNIGANNSEYQAYDKTNYTTRDLFQDLVWAAYLNGGIQEASQYVKYIPQAYLHMVPFAKELVNWINNINVNERFDIINDAHNYEASHAIKQIVQNNPEQLPKITKEDIINYNKVKLLNADVDTAKPYMSMYDESTPHGTKNFRLYTLGNLIEYKGTYYYELVELPVVGTSGKDKVSEYNYLRNGYVKSVYGTTKEKTESSKVSEPVKPSESNKSTTMNSKIKPNITPVEANINALSLSDSKKNPISGSKIIENVLGKISKNSTDAFHKTVAKALLDKMKNIDLSKFEVVLVKDLPMKDGGQAAGKVIELQNGGKMMKINIGISQANDINKLEHTILHEFVHVLTMDTIRSPKTQTQKDIVKRLTLLREELKNYFKTSDKYKEAYESYISKSTKEIRNADDYMFYATTNNDDFVALMLGNKNLQNVANSIMVKNESLLQKFIDNIIDILNSLGFEVKKGTVLETALDSILKIMDPVIETKTINIKETISNIKTIPLKTNFTRNSVKEDSDYIYLFTDNAKRTSGSNKIELVNHYTIAYAPVHGYLYYPNTTQAVIRGLNNAFPITTMVDDKRTQWTDDKYNEYKEIIDKEINFIKRAVDSNNFKGIKFSANMQFGKGNISNMKESAPKIWNYMNQKLKEIGIDNLNISKENLSSNELFGLDVKDVIDNEKKPLFDNEGFLNDDAYIPSFVPSSKDIMKQFDELNEDGTAKKLIVSDENYKKMLNRAIKINKGQPYYKATVGQTPGENISTKSKDFFRIYLTPRTELSNIEYLADLVPDNLLKEVMKQCK